MGEYISVLKLEELPENGNIAIEVKRRSVLLCRSGNNIFAVANRCSHQAKPLEGGRVRDNCITCPMHGERFDLETGKPQGKLTRVPVAVYPVRIVEGWIQVAIL